MIHAEQISKRYGEVQALQNISFSVEKGSTLGIIGPDGAGKTTLFRILSTVLLPDSGYASIDGLDTKKDYQAIRNTIGYMPGRFSLYRDLTVNENLEFYASVFRTTIAENYYLIKDIYSRIEPFKNRRAGALSGGMKQKLALSCALIHSPSVLFLDEPTTGVDPVSRKEFWEMLKRLKQQGITIVVSTPYMDEVTLCDNIMFIQNGEIMGIDTPEKIVAGYSGNLYSLRSENNYNLLKLLKQNGNIEICYISGEYVRVVFKTNEVPEIENVEVFKFEPTVEDCFIKAGSRKTKSRS